MQIGNIIKCIRLTNVLLCKKYNEVGFVIYGAKQKSSDKHISMWYSININGGGCVMAKKDKTDDASEKK